MTLYSEIDHEDYYDSLAIALMKKKHSSKFPTDEELKNALLDKDLYNIKTKNRNYMFELLENHNNREYVDTGNDKITVEHIFPRNPNEEWKQLLPYDEYNLFKDRLLNTIGNLTLSGNNGALSNKSFLVKKEMNNDAGEQGYKFSRLWLNDYIKGIESWTKTEYYNRSQIIYSRFLNIWHYPDIEITVSEDNSEENIFDIESATHKKLEYFIFENTRVEETATAQMYFYVIKKLFQINAQLILNNPDILKVTKSEEDFRAAQEIINGYFFETNIDSNSKFKVLKKLLTLFEMEDELFIKLSSESETESTSRFAVRKEFWKQLLPQIVNTSLFANVNPTKDHWLGTGAGISGLSFTLVITRTYVAIEFTISRASKQENKMIFQQLFLNKSTIEESFGDNLIWEELPTKKMSRIKTELGGVNLFENQDWNKMSEFIILNLPKFEKSFVPFIDTLKVIKN